MTHKPSIKSFLLADHVFRQDTGKWCVIGVFSKIFAQSVPAIHPTLGILLVISDAEGDYEVRLEVRDPNDKVVTSMQGMRIGVRSRLDQAEFGMQTYRLPIPNWGRYYFKIYFNGEAADLDATLDVVKVEASNG